MMVWASGDSVGVLVKFSDGEDPVPVDDVEDLLATRQTLHEPEDVTPHRRRRAD